MRRYVATMADAMTKDEAAMAATWYVAFSCFTFRAARRRDDSVDLPDAIASIASLSGALTLDAMIRIDRIDRTGQRQGNAFCAPKAPPTLVSWNPRPGRELLAFLHSCNVEQSDGDEHRPVDSTSIFKTGVDPKARK